MGLLQQPLDPWTRTQARGAFEDSGEFAAVVSTVYGINNSASRVPRYIDDMYHAIPGNNGNQTNDTAALEAAAAEGQAQVVLAARTMGINLFQPWLTGSQTNEQFTTALFNAFLQREPSAVKVNTWVTTVQSQGRSQTLQSFATLPATQELAATLYREILWLTPDHLGTPRMISERSGSLVGIRRNDYLPFGEEMGVTQGARSAAMGYGTDQTRQKFTSYERDNETGLDYAQARYYSNTQGRFSSVDPLMASARATNPQSWNRYSYVLNKPLNLIDPSGLSARSSAGGCSAEFSNCDEEEGGNQAERNYETRLQETYSAMAAKPLKRAIWTPSLT